MLKTVISMRNNRWLSWPLLLFLFFAQASRALAFPHQLGQTFSIRDGLSNGFAVDMAIDGQGFVWVATESGLNRIAGDRCLSFRKSNSALRFDELVGICYHDKSQTLWVWGKGAQLDVFDCRTQQFSQPKIAGKTPDDIAAVCPASDGGLWLAHYDGDVHHLDPKTGKTKFIPRSRFPHIRHGVRTIADDGKGHLYLGLRMEGLILYNLRTGKVRHFVCGKNDVSGLPGNNVRRVFVDHQRRVWLGTNGGLSLLDLAKGVFRNFRNDPSNATSLAGDNIYDISETPRHTLLVASDIAGVSTLDLDHFERQPGKVVFGRLTREAGSLSSNHARRVMQDAYGNIWVANYAMGVDFLPARQASFYELMLDGKRLEGVTGLFYDSRGWLWASQDNLLTVMAGGMRIRQYDISPYISNSSAVVYVFCEDLNGNIWMGTSDNGVLVLNPVTGRFAALPQTEGLDVNALFVGSDGRVWIGTEGGVFSSKGGVVRREHAINRLIGTNAVPCAFGEDAYGRLWIGTLVRGVLVVAKNGQSGVWLKGLPSPSVNQIMRASDGSMWLSTHQGLVCVPSPKRLTGLRTYGVRQGMADSHVRAVVEGADGNIWMSLFSGIACYDRRRNCFYNYDFRSGIPVGNFVS